MFAENSNSKHNTNNYKDFSRRILLDRFVDRLCTMIDWDLNENMFDMNTMMVTIEYLMSMKLMLIIDSMEVILREYK